MHIFFVIVTFLIDQSSGSAYHMGHVHICMYDIGVLWLNA